MIYDELRPQALKALQRLIVHAKAQAHADGNDELAALLNDMELLPEFVADSADRTDEFLETIQGIAQTHPACRYIVEDFQESAARSC